LLFPRWGLIAAYCYLAYSMLKLLERFVTPPYFPPTTESDRLRAEKIINSLLDELIKGSIMNPKKSFVMEKFSVAVVPFQNLDSE
jgi:hypothetical protein